MHKLTSLFAIASLGFSSLCAQNNTSSPYSRYGFGELVEPGFGYTKSLGGLSAGVRSFSHINSGNPASYTSIDSMGFRFEFGASVKSSSFKDNDYEQQSWDTNLDYLGLQFPIKKWAAFSAGIQPYSFVGYEFSNKHESSSSISTGSLADTVTYTGSGGVTQCFFGLAFQPFKHFNVGVNGYYNFGKLNHESRVGFANSAYHGTIQTNEISVHDWSVGFGAQYEIPLAEKRNLTLGATLNLPSKVKADANKEIVTPYIDTVSVNFDNSFGLPLTFGAGFAYDINESMLVGADYKFQKWSDAEYFGEKVFDDRHRFACGVDIHPDKASKNYLKRISYRAGMNVANSYFKVNDKDFNQMAASLGFGFPLRRVSNPSYLNLGLEYGRAGKQSEDLILEKYFKVSLNLSINERWFVKRKFE